MRKFKCNLNNTILIYIELGLRTEKDDFTNEKENTIHDENLALLQNKIEMMKLPILNLKRCFKI